MFGIKKNKNNLNDNLSGNKFVSDNNTMKVKGNNITNNYVKLNKNDKIEFAEKIAETEYNIDILTRKIFCCQECKANYSNVINSMRERCSRNNISLCFVSDIDVLLSLHPDDLNFICTECKNNIEKLRQLKHQLNAYNKILGIK